MSESRKFLCVACGIPTASRLISRGRPSSRAATGYCALHLAEAMRDMHEDFIEPTEMVRSTGDPKIRLCEGNAVESCQWTFAPAAFLVRTSPGSVQYSCIDCAPCTKQYDSNSWVLVALDPATGDELASATIDDTGEQCSGESCNEDEEHPRQVVTLHIAESITAWETCEDLVDKTVMDIWQAAITGEADAGLES